MSDYVRSHHLTQAAIELNETSSRWLRTGRFRSPGFDDPESRRIHLQGICAGRYFQTVRCQRSIVGNDIPPFVRRHQWLRWIKIPTYICVHTAVGITLTLVFE